MTLQLEFNFSPKQFVLRLNDASAVVKGPSLSDNPGREAIADQPSSLLTSPFPQQPALQLIYDTAPIGLAFLSPDCPLSADQPAPTPVDDILAPLRGADGEIVGVNVAAEEITERKHAEAALQASEREFRTLADTIPQLIWMAEASGKIFWFNSHWYDYADVHGGETVQPEWQAMTVDPAVGGKAPSDSGRNL